MLRMKMSPTRLLAATWFTLLLFSACTPSAVPIAIQFAPSPIAVPDTTANQTVVDTVSVTMSDHSTFTGTLAITSCGVSPCPFSVVGNSQIVANRNFTSADDQTGRSMVVTATQNGHSTQGTLPWSVVAAVTVSAITLDNGPPNIPNANPCTTMSCSWIGSNWPSGTHVSFVWADMSPISSDYTGSFTLSDQPNHTGDASHFSISTATNQAYTNGLNVVKNRSVGEIKTSGAVTARD